jgi:hypothetical protein
LVGTAGVQAASNSAGGPAKLSAEPRVTKVKTFTDNREGAVSDQLSTPAVFSRGPRSAGGTNQVILGITVGLLLFSLGCGGSQGSIIPVTGNFSNSSLKGNYQYQLFGIGLDVNGNNNYYAEAGIFFADGNGNITSGRDDFNQLNSDSSAVSNPITGTYTIGMDGNGFITLNLPDAQGSFQLAVTMISTSQLYLTEADVFANASGIANQQDTSKFSSAPSGTFVVRVHTVSTTGLVGGVGSLATVGTLTFNAPNVTGSLDVLRKSALSQVTLTAGNVTAPDATGRGTLSTTDSLGFTNNYLYYVIDGATLALLQTDANLLALGRAELQGAAPFSINGSYAFGSSGDTSAGVGFARSVGALTVSGGSVSGGTYDSVQDLASISNQSISSGQVTGPDSRGRATVVLTPSSGGNPITDVLWMVNSSRAFFLVNDPNKVEDGTADLQTSSSFTNSDLNGQYALVNNGFTTLISPNSFLTRVGTFIPNGTSSLSLNEWVNSYTGSSLTSVSQQVQITGGTYTVGTNGRAVAALPQLSNNLILYLVSPNQAYMLQNDTGAEISGQVTLQVSQ